LKRYVPQNFWAFHSLAPATPLLVNFFPTGRVTQSLLPIGALRPCPGTTTTANLLPLPRSQYSPRWNCTVSQQLQPQDPNTPLQSQIQLVKLGSEIHGPTSDMKINRDQILFIENLKPDSQVLKAILDQKKAAEKTPAQ
jgi:hypothetical protein